jgi:hypothetical protein
LPHLCQKQGKLPQALWSSPAPSDPVSSMAVPINGCYCKASQVTRSCLDLVSNRHVQMRHQDWMANSQAGLGACPGFEPAIPIISRYHHLQVWQTWRQLADGQTRAQSTGTPENPP